MQIVNKKGLSNVISVVIIIMLSITLIGILSTGIFNILNDPTLSPSQSCLVLDSKNVLEIEHTCYNDLTKDLEVTVRRSGDKTLFLNSIQFTLDDSITWECGNSCGTCKLLQPGNSRKYFFNTIEAKSLALKANNCLVDLEKISICN
tara:strand:- start:145 stop:585 length:441 start_codon:yes stop_codon:yes gene_type:complete